MWKRLTSRTVSQSMRTACCLGPRIRRWDFVRPADPSQLMAGQAEGSMPATQRCSRVARGVGISVVPIPWYVPDDDAGRVVAFAERVQIERRVLGR